MSVVVFGSLNMDLVTRVKRLPRPGETLMGSAFFTTAGGKGANQAVAAAKLGAAVAMIGRVGDDAWGTELIAGLAAVGVETEGIAIEPGVHSGVAVITVAESGENQILGVYGANDRLDESDVARLKTRLVGAKVLLLQLEVPVKAVRQAAQVAHEMGVTVVLDPAPVREESIEACYPFVDFLVPNETEASELVGFEVSDLATATQASLILHRQGLKKLIIKLGEKGAYYSTLCSSLDSTDWESQLKTQFIPAFKVNAIDAVAAGDAFAGGFAVAVAEGQTEIEAVRWGCAAGALATTKVGAQVAMSDRVTFNQFLAGVQ
jgi:ribokinase